MPQYQKWVLFACGAVCIASVGISAHFFERQRKERERRINAENELKTLASEFQLLREKNRELAEQLLEAKRIAEEIAREREQAWMVAANTPPEGKLPLSEAPSQTVDKPLEAKSSSFVAAVKRIRLDQLTAAAGKAKDAVGEGWREFRTALASGVRTPGATEEVLPAEKPRLSQLIEAFPLAGLRQAAAEVQQSARKTVMAMRTMLSFKPESSTAAASLPAPPPPDTPKKLTATDEELRNELAQVRQEKRELEKQIAERTGKIPGSVDVGRVRVTTGRRFSGKVLAVNPKYGFVVIDIGRNQGLDKGVVLIVHRGNKFVGKAEVIKVYEKMAAADLVTDWMQDEVQVNDGVKKF